jgi:hypothetical protein
MANAVNTKSTLSLGDGSTNKTSTSISTHIIIYVNGVPVGAVKNLSVSESRELKFIDEVGTDGHIDSTPVRSTNISGSCERVRFDRLRIAEAFGRSFVHVSSQAYPFDIVILDRQKSDNASQISTVIKNVWIKNISYAYNADDWVITDKMDWEAETIYSVLAGGDTHPILGKSVAVGGERGSPAGYGESSWIERKTDTGESRGSLDASGLIDIGSSNYGPGIY